jgi:hypothetical protein
MPLQIVPGPIWFFGTNTSREEIGAMKKRQATLAGQTAECGMRMIQTSFPRIKDPFAYKERGEWRIRLKMLLLVYNMCKDGLDKSDLEYIREAFESKCKHRCFLLIICIALTPWAWGVPLEGRKRGPQD